MSSTITQTEKTRLLKVVPTVKKLLARESQIRSLERQLEKAEQSYTDCCCTISAKIDACIDPESTEAYDGSDDPCCDGLRNFVDAVDRLQRMLEDMSTNTPLMIVRAIKDMPVRSA